MLRDIIKILLGKRARKAPFATLIEIIRMRFGSQRLSFSEYILYRFHELDDLSAEERGRFLGSGRKFRLNYICNDLRWFMLGEKLPMTLFLMSTDIPMPKVHAIYDTNGRNLPGAVSLNNPEEVIHYLSNNDHYPLFVKPSHSAYGWGAVGLKHFLPDSQEILLLDEKKVNLETWVKSLTPDSAHGILFQELIVPHPEIARICGSRASSVRVSTARIDGKVSIVSAVWRIPSGTNMIDNFQHGASGNLLGGIDAETGRIKRVVGLVNGKIDHVSHHPDTHITFEDYVLPDWQKVKDICLKGAHYLMGMNLHHWDVALTNRGPIIVENNEIADLDLHQHGNRKGYWSDDIEKVKQQSYQRYWHERSRLEKLTATVLRKLDQFQ